MRLQTISRKLTRVISSYCKLFSELIELGDDLESIVQKIQEEGVKENSSKLSNYASDLLQDHKVFQRNVLTQMLEKYCEVKERLVLLAKKKDCSKDYVEKGKFGDRKKRKGGGEVELITEIPIILYLLSSAFRRTATRTSRTSVCWLPTPHIDEQEEEFSPPDQPIGKIPPILLTPPKRERTHFSPQYEPPTLSHTPTKIKRYSPQLVDQQAPPRQYITGKTKSFPSAPPDESFDLDQKDEFFTKKERDSSETETTTTPLSHPQSITPPHSSDNLLENSRRQKSVERTPKEEKLRRSPSPLPLPPTTTPASQNTPEKQPKLRRGTFDFGPSSIFSDKSSKFEKGKKSPKLSLGEREENLSSTGGHQLAKKELFLGSPPPSRTKTHFARKRSPTFQDFFDPNLLSGNHGGVSFSDEKKSWRKSKNTKEQYKPLSPEEKKTVQLKSELKDRDSKERESKDSKETKGSSELKESAGKMKEDELSLTTLSELVRALTDEENFDNELRVAFFLTYKKFCSPLDVILELSRRYFGLRSSDKKFSRNILSAEGDIIATREVLPQVALRVVSVLKYWMNENFLDIISDEETTSSLLTLFDEILKNQESTGKLLIKFFETRKTQVKHEKPPFDALLPPTNIQWDTFNEAEVSLALTLYEHELFSEISTQEFMSWPLEEKRSSFCFQIQDFISFSNSVSAWITSELVSRVRLQDRVKLFTKFVSMLEQLLDLKNFSSCMSVIGGITSSPFWRMKKTWGETERETIQVFQKIRDIMSHHSSYAEYRAFLSGSTPPCVPYIGVHLSDLTFIEEGNPDMSLGLIHFRKWRMIAKVIEEIKFYQQTPYDCPSSAVLSSARKALSEYQFLSEEERYEYSNYVEPKDAEAAMESLLERYHQTQKKLQEANLLLSQFQENRKETPTTERKKKGAKTTKRSATSIGPIPPLDVEPP